MFKRVLSLMSLTALLSLNVTPVFAECSRVEHLDINKKAPCNTVTITDVKRTVNQGNVLELQFTEKFFSKTQQAGDIVYFVVPQALYTQEGTLILPANTKIVAEVTEIQKPKWFNKNARVNMLFKQIVLPDNSCIELKAVPFTKDGKFKEGPWTTFGKVALSTVTLGIIGAGAGVGFAFIPNPAKIGTGLAAGIPAGCGIGLILGLVTPGCHYKAKLGESVYAILLEEFSVCEGCK
ncbi:MAG: hypothetical protein MJ231_07120 [bacterium]|nr:hypothetical protein [bacterium]